MIPKPKSIPYQALGLVRQQHAKIERRRAAAVSAFWSDDPLNLSFRKVVGNTFSLKAFISFVVEMPEEQFVACTGGRNAD